MNHPGKDRTTAQLGPEDEEWTIDTDVTRASRLSTALPFLVVLAHVLVVAPDLDLPVLRPLVAFAGLIGVPVLVLHRRAGLPVDTAAGRLLTSLGIVLLGLVLVALLLNFALPPVGVDRPLQPLVLALTSAVVDLGLLLWRRNRAPDLLAGWGPVIRSSAGARFELAQTLAGLSVVVAVVGAVRLDNGAGGGVAVLGHLLVAAALVALAVSRRGVAPTGGDGEDAVLLRRDCRVVYLAATSLLLATSLRGWTIIGHDIQAEHLAYVLTDHAQRWQMDTFKDAYNACLSITILPSVLSQVTGLPATWVFKLVAQLVFAVVPVLTFLLARRFVPRSVALAATVFTLAFPTFHTDMPYLVRQEVAYLFVALLLLVATDPGRDRRTPWLVAFLGLGVVLSHYSTTYVLLMALVLGLVVLVAWRLVARLRHRRVVTQGRPVLLSPVLILFLAVASVVWTGPVTHTAGHASEVAGQVVDTLLGRGGDTPGASVLSFRLFSGENASPRDRLDLYVDATLKARKEVDPATLLVRNPGRDLLRPAIVPASTAPPTAVGRALGNLGIPPSTATTLMRLGCAGILQLFLVIGVVRVLARRRDRTFPDELVCLAIGAVGALGVIVLIPQLSVDYGVLRAFQQTLLVVAPFMAVGLVVTAGLARSWATRVSVAVPVLVLLVLSGVVPAAVGAYVPPLALGNRGVYYDRYYVKDSELAAVRWLAARTRSDPAPVISNRDLMLRFATATRLQARGSDRLFPTLLTRGSYVVADEEMRTRDVATVFYTGDLITYRYPLALLDRRLDVVWSAGKSRVYR